MSPRVHSSHQLTLGVVPSVGLDRCVMTGVHPYSVIQREVSLCMSLLTLSMVLGFHRVILCLLSAVFDIYDYLPHLPFLSVQ